MSRLSRLMRTRLYARARNVINSPDKRQSKMFNFGIDKSKEVCYSVLSKTNSTERRNTKMMKAKRVLDKLAETYNDYTIAYGYAAATGDSKTADELQTAINVISELVRNLGFISGVDYTTERVHGEMANVSFMYWKMEKCGG